MDQRDAAGLAVGIEHVEQADQPLVRHARADLDRHRVANAAVELDVRAVELRGAHADPRKVRRQVVVAGAARHLAGLRLLVRQRERLVARVDVDAAQHLVLDAGDRADEVERLADRLDDLRVRVGVRRAVREREVPVLGVVQIGEAAVGRARG